MDDTVAILAFMRAHILSQRPHGIDAWDPETLRHVYHMLPTPGTPFEDWCKRVGIVLTSDMQKDTEEFVEGIKKSKAQGLAPDITIIEGPPHAAINNG